MPSFPAPEPVPFNSKLIAFSAVTFRKRTNNVHKMTENRMNHGTALSLHMPRPAMRVGFFLPQDLSLTGLNSAADMLRLANRAANRTLYEWQTIALSRDPLKATNGISITPDTDIAGAGHFDMLFVCGAIGIERMRHPKVLRWLREAAFRGTVMGSITNGAYTLALAGLLDGYRCTIHGEDEALFRADFPEVALSRTLYVVDRDRITSAGGIVTVDLFIHLARLHAGDELARAMTAALHLDRLRSQSEEQNIVGTARAQIPRGRVLEAVALMENHLENPLALGALADGLGVTLRQLNRMFHKAYDQPPGRVYRDIRLRRARLLVLSSNAALSEIAALSGFATQSSFSRCYRSQYGLAPLRDRERAMARQSLG